MEVHHHPDIHHKKKKIKEYFIEFIMIFLAVSMGFFAESLREKISDNKHIREFTKGLIRDINSNAAECDSEIVFMQSMVSTYDTLLTLLNENSPSLNKMYYHFAQTGSYTTFTGACITIDQLKNTGQMRLFSDIDAADSINFYYANLNSVKDYHDTYIRSFWSFHDDAFQIFQYSQMGSKYFARDSLLSATMNFKLLTPDYQLRQKLYNKLFILKLVTLEYIYDMKSLKSNALSCIVFLERKLN